MGSTAEYNGTLTCGKVGSWFLPSRLILALLSSSFVARPLLSAPICAVHYTLLHNVLIAWLGSIPLGQCLSVRLAFEELEKAHLVCIAPATTTN
jgi:hypothetical protein